MEVSSGGERRTEVEVLSGGAEPKGIRGGTRWRAGVLEEAEERKRRRGSGAHKHRRDAKGGRGLGVEERERSDIPSAPRIQTSAWHLLICTSVIGGERLSAGAAYA